MPHKPHVILLLLGLVLTAPPMPAHAVPITIDSAGRGVRVDGFAPPVSFGSSSLGFFSETASVSASDESADALAIASQISNISVLGNVLTINNASSASFSILQKVDDVRYQEVGHFSGVVSSGLAVQFTLDNWASYEAHSLLSGFEGLPAFTALDLGPIFSLIGTVDDTRSGLLAPGTYTYRSTALAVFLFPDRGTISPFVFSSLRVSIVPEPSSLLLLGLGLIGFIGWRERQWRQTSKA